MVNQAVIAIEVVYGLPDRQFLIALEVIEGTTVLEAINQSGVLVECPTINLAKQRVGIFSRFVELSEVVRSGDRIEIYRPLLIDPKEARRAKAKKR